MFYVGLYKCNGIQTYVRMGDGNRDKKKKIAAAFKSYRPKPVTVFDGKKLK